ncbi:MAG: hypothetical protein M0T70_05555 [Geobacteraceae bacterium]|nr:hypothetical protein [Geobacteraceae bacterium]
MTEKRTMLWLLVSGMFISATTPLCHAHDTGSLSDINPPPAMVSPALVPANITAPPPRPLEEQPGTKVSERSRYWRLLEGVAISAAQYNTEKNDDGRPHPFGNPH